MLLDGYQLNELEERMLDKSMTEEEWLTAEKPNPMLYFLAGLGSERKLRLYLHACLLRTLQCDEYFTQVLAVGERLAEGRASEEDRQRVLPLVSDYHTHHFPSVAAIVSPLTVSWLYWGAETAARDVASSFFPTDDPSTWNEAEWESHFNAEVSTQCDLLRDIFGNPFRPTGVDLRWLTPTVVALANGIYAERAFDRLPILADSLEEAGCDHAGILNHCRGDGPHVRGCWVVDLLLRKS